VTEEQLAGCHPAYAAYVYAQNQVSVMSEQLTGLKEMAPFAHIVSEAEDLYLPSAPPMSPLTTSYFTCDAERDGVVCRYTPNLARHPWRAHRGRGVRRFRSIRRGQNSLPRIMHGKYREILALATPTAASKTTSKLLPCYCSCYYFRLIWPLPEPA
jgi:hypothetical protein